MLAGELRYDGLMRSITASWRARHALGSLRGTELRYRGA
jgi:hypothetical protein